jgi:hypothetical protein
MEKLRNYFANKRDSLKAYFKDNLTAYTYLFFAQAVAVAANIYVNFIAHNPPFHLHAFPILILIILSSIYALLMPFLFIIAAVATFNYNSLGKDSRRFMIGINLILCAIIITSASAAIS